MPPETKAEEVCILALRGRTGSPMAYSAGFQYELLQSLGRETFRKFDISIIGPADSLPDADLFVLPFSDSLDIPADFFVSPVLPDSTVWLIPPSREDLIRSVHTWTVGFMGSPGFRWFRERFTPSYDPFREVRRIPVARISPYDDLLKKYAARIGWDWRLFAALTWKESKFHIEARSAAGAEGLMQMMPHTARRHRTSDMLDPEDNLRAATEYIERLQKMFADTAADPEELTRFTLAAYNAGEGRVLDLIRHAEALGKPRSRWADLKVFLPAVQDKEDSLATDISLPRGFWGHETVRFLADIEAVYERFQTLVP